MPKGKKLIGVLVALGIVAVGFAAMSLLSARRKEPPKSEPELRDVVVSVEPVVLGAVSR